MTEELKPELAPIEEKMTQELVKANVTEAVISTLRERYLPLKIAGLEDKETYLLVKEGRKECKSLRVMAKKICTNGREEATAIQKAWIAKEKEVTGRIAEVEDYLEAQEKEYEAGIAAEKEARKRKQEEQLILRQQKLTAMGALYSDGKFTLGEVSFELSVIKESEDDIWDESILPKFYEEYNKIELDRIAEERKKQEQEAELKRQQEELELERKRLKDESDRLQAEKERQEAEAREKKAAQLKSRRDQLAALGFTYNGINGYGYYEYLILHCDVEEHGAANWDGLIDEAKKYVAEREKEEAEEKRKEQERKDLQNKRYAQLLPFKEYGEKVNMDGLGLLSEGQYVSILAQKSHEYNVAEEEKANKIAEEAAKKERERIEEEQRQAEIKRKDDLRRDRTRMLVDADLVYPDEYSALGGISEEAWMKLFDGLKADRAELIRKQEEERKAEELAKAGDKEKWNEIMERVEAIEVYAMRSSQYRKKAAILREKLEEIKAL